ncbi:MAG TPA: hypothetical protein VL262_01720, partial [Vicinamibacterales bacterium]|nr:hypothetical protein [Vicinamibacterales bacterium]
LGAWQKVSIIDAGHFDAQTAYAAINTLRLDDLRPHILRTHDGGKTWTEIVNGIPAGETVNAVREDTKRKGLLFASTERTVYVSFDDGAIWQSLRLNLPVSSVRDVVVKDNDLVIATHGRSFWILDDISPLRQAEPSMQATLFKPAVAMRVRWNTNTDTPIPPDVPAGQNPPDGAVIDYFLPGAASNVKLEILDSTQNVIRTYASTDQPEPIDPNLAIPSYWVRPPRVLSAAAGMHRWLWDLHLQPAPSGRPQYPMQAVVRDTPPAPSSPWVMPGQYTVRLTVDGKTLTQPLTVTMDPRVKTEGSALRRQFALSKSLYDQIVTINAAIAEAQAARRKIGAGQAGSDALNQKIDAVAGREQQGFGGGGRFGGGNAPETLTSIRGSLTTLLGELQGADVAPTAAIEQAVTEKLAAAPAIVAKWNELKKELPQ